MDDNLRRKFEARYRTWKEKLLDLSGSNRLLNFRSTKVSTIQLTLPDTQGLFERLVVSEKPLKFPLFDGRVSLAADVVDSETSPEGADSAGGFRALRPQDRTDRRSSQFQVDRELCAGRCGRPGSRSAFATQGNRDQSIRVRPPLSCGGCGSLRARSPGGLSRLQNLDGVQVGANGRPVAEQRKAGCLPSERKTRGQAKEDCRTIAVFFSNSSSVHFDAFRFAFRVDKSGDYFASAPNGARWMISIRVPQGSVM